MAAFEMTRKGWMWIYAILVVLIISILLIKVSKAGNKTTVNPAATGTDCCGELENCYGLSKDQIIELQEELNDEGCKDYNGNELKVDGLCGPLTNSAIKNCK